MELGHIERTVQHKKVDGIGKVAQPSSYIRNQFPSLNHATVFVALFRSYLSRQPEERERLPGADDKPVHGIDGNFEVHDLILLKHGIDAFSRLDEHIALMGENNRKPLFAAFRCEALGRTYVLDMPLRYLFLH